MVIANKKILTMVIAGATRTKGISAIFARSAPVNAPSKIPCEPEPKVDERRRYRYQDY